MLIWEGLVCLWFHQAQFTLGQLGISDTKTWEKDQDQATYYDQIVGLQLFLHILNIGLLQKLKFKDAGKSASMWELYKAQANRKPRTMKLL